MGERLVEVLEAADDGYLSGNTVRALRADLERFAAWCAERGSSPLPARAATVVAYVEAMESVRAPATVRRYVSSIAAVHKAAGKRSPAEHATVRRALSRMRRRKGSRQEQVEGLTWALRRRLIEAAGGGERLIDIRNRAILAVAYDAMLRRSELVALQVVDVTMDRGGSASLLVRRAKTDPEGGGAVLYLHRDSVRMLKEWLGASGIGEGPLFRSMRKDGSVGGALHGSQVPRIYKAMAERAGLPAKVVRRLSGHSPRVGAAQDMIASGIGIAAIMQAGRWRSPRMVQRYGERLLAKRNGAAQLARLQKRR
ncbi:site-specific integrase [Candidatus Palauibacter sp.]|uniref:site-specific integrase n=1 Tax=Candidatus Palauibacter sp. TaxID=3101350 RepID=UPI003B5B6158